MFLQGIGMTEQKKISRRSYIKYAGAGVVAVAAAAAGGYYYTSMQQPPPTTLVTTTAAATTAAATTAAATTAAATVSLQEVFDVGAINWEKATKPLAEPKEWTTPPAKYRDKKELVLGGSTPLTGIFSWAVTWYKLRKKFEEKLNAEGGILGLPVRLLLYDDGSDASRAISNYTKLITVDKVDLLLGPIPTATSVPVMDAIDKYEYKPVLMCGNADYFSILGANSGKGYKTGFAIQMASQNNQYATWAWIKSLPEDKKPKKAGLIYGSYSPYTLGLEAGGKYWSKDAGVDVVYDEGYASGLTDYTPLVSAAKAAGTQLLCDDATESSPGKLILEACHAMDWQPEAYWSLHVIYPGYEDPKIKGQLNPWAYYTLLPVMQWPTWPDPPFLDTKYWTDQYIDVLKISGVPNFDACFPIMELQMLQQAVNATGSIEMQDLNPYLMQHSFNTILGHVEFTDRKTIRGLTCAQGQIDGQGREQVIWPKEFATMDPVYPRPPWNEYMK
jgi:branched-chain amino acid transport system substrate-binding protein